MRPFKAVAARLLPLAALLGCASDAAPDAERVDEIRMGKLTAAADSIQFVEIRDILMDSMGVWILDSAEPYITLVDPQGELLLRFGSEGQGPGQFQNPVALEDAGPGEPPGIVVWDLGNARVSIFDSQGDLTREDRIEDSAMGSIRANIRSVAFPDPFRIRRVGEALAYVRYPAGLFRSSDFRSGTLVTSSSESLTASEEVMAFREAAAGIPSGHLGELGPLPLWDACADGTVVVWLPEVGALRWFNRQGEVVGQSTPELPSRALEDPDIERYLRAMARLELGASPEERGIDIRSMVRTRRGHFARVAPVATDLRCSEDGSGWLRLFDTSAHPLGHGFRWARVTAGGSGSLTLGMPVGFSPFVVRSTVMVGVLEAQSGDQTVAWLDINDAPAGAQVTGGGDQ